MDKNVGTKVSLNLNKYDLSFLFNKFFHNYYRVASKVIHIETSPDSTLVATVGEVFFHIVNFNFCMFGFSY
jgi:hypothetical protein